MAGDKRLYLLIAAAQANGQKSAETGSEPRSAA
jgi:hypothetical protein